MKTVWLDLPVRNEVSITELIGCRAGILGHTAYPGNAEKVKEVASALRRLEGVPQRYSTKHRLLDKENALKIVAEAAEIIYRERVVCALAYINTYESGPKNGRTKGITSYAPTGAYLAGLKIDQPVKDQHPSLSEKNFLTRHWETTKPVLHMALALQEILFSGDSADINQLVFGATWLKVAVATAEWHRIQIDATSRFLKPKKGWDSGFRYDSNAAIRFVPRPLVHEQMCVNYNDILVPLFRDLPEN